jgi:hypothetical protein
MDKNLILKKLKQNKFINTNPDTNPDSNTNTNPDINPGTNPDINTDTNIDINNKNMNIKIYIYNNNLLEFYNILNNSINKFSNFTCSIFTGNIKINNNDFIIYPEDILDNPFGFKNVIRLIQSNSFSIYPSTDIILYYSETESIIKKLFDSSLHPILIDYYTNEFYNKEIHLTNLDKNNIKKIDDLINRKLYLQNIIFTDPIINLFNKNGLKSNVLNIPIILDNISIEIEFKITSHNNQCIFNFSNISLNISSEGNLLFNNNVIQTNIEFNKIHFLKLCFTNNQIMYNYDNIISSIIFNTKQIDNIFINNDNKTILYSFRIYNYTIPIFKEIDSYVNNYDRFNLDYPKKIFNCFISNNDHNINYQENLDNITIKFLLNKSNQLDILLDVGDIKIEQNINRITINFKNNNYSIKIVEFPVCVCISLNPVNNLMIVKTNNNIKKINILNSKININNIFISKLLYHPIITNYTINQSLLLDDIQTYINYFDTFGFMKFDNLFIDSNEKLIRAFEYNIVNNKKNDIIDYIPCAMEYLEYFVDITINKKIHTILGKLFSPKKYYYSGSDSKIYSSDTNWHCDRITNNLHLKCAFYLNKLDENTGCLRVLPGSQNFNDKYNSVLSKKVIPLFQGPGGFDPTFFPVSNQNLPYHPIKIDFGDFVIFNLKLYHSAFGNNINKKMICMNLTESYENKDNNDSISEKLECINSDCYIIANLKKNIDFSTKIKILDNNYYNYIKGRNEYQLYFKELIENDNRLDSLVRMIIRNKNEDQKNLELFVNSIKNTSTKKSDKTITVNNHII